MSDEKLLWLERQGDNAGSSDRRSDGNEAKQSDIIIAFSHHSLLITHYEHSLLDCTASPVLQWRGGER
jgi:hypothetical protein